LKARQEYEAALVQIATLEQDLLGRDNSKHRTISECVMRVIPKDRSFSTQDVYVALEALDPTRYWRKRTIDTVMTSLRERKIVKRIKRGTIHEPALYALVDSDITPPWPLADVPLHKAVRMVLTRPMTTAEVTVAVTEAGYRSAMKPEYLRQHVVRELQKGFKRQGEKWMAG
jgi:hypothetical protein